MIFRSAHADLSIPEIPLTEFVLQRAHALCDKPALIEGTSGRVITYQQLSDSIRRAGIGLARRGLRKGDVLALYCPNIPEYAVAFHAVASLGGINTTVNPLYTADELAHQLGDAGAKYLLTVPPLLDKALAAAGRSQIQEVFVIGEAEGATSFAELLQDDGELPEVEIDPRNDLVALPYSSGTTGLPKGVMLTHHNLVANLLQTEQLKLCAGDDTSLCVLPMFHIYGLTVILNLGLYTGATVVTMPRFELEQFLRIVQDYKVTLLPIVPPIALALMQRPIIDSYDLSSIKIIFSGAAPLGAEVSRACAARLNCVIRQGYGMTETSPVTHASPLAPDKIKLGSVGQCAPNTECRLVDLDSGAELDANQEGEIHVRGPQVMKGYLNRPEATAQTLTADHWLRTGDIGYADADGHFYIVDRAKELIKYKGFQVAPAELEAVLLTHPAVADAAVIPCPDEEAGEIPKAFVVFKPGEAIEAETLINFVAERLAPYKKIRRLEVIEQIPKSASGKILRRVLVERERERKVKQ